MNTRPILDSSTGPFALSVSLNPDISCFSVALENGFRVFSAQTGDLRLAREMGGGLGSVEMLGTTEYLAIVGGGRQPKFPQNKIHIWNDRTQKVATTLEFNSPVQRVRISRHYVVVVLLNSVKIYKMKVPPEKLAEYETVNNPYGICHLGDEHVVYPGIVPGQVKIYNLRNGNVSIIPAHESPLRTLALNRGGTMVATASEQGTLIRLWGFPSCSKLMEFRRGVDPAVIFSMAFSPSGSMLAVTSDKSTVHIFDLPDENSGAYPIASSSANQPQQHKWGLLSRVPFLPRQFSDTYSSLAQKFEIGNEPEGWGTASKSATFNAGIPGVPGGRPTKGLVGWLNGHSFIVIGAGQDARWEKFNVGETADGKRGVEREGWKSYLE